ncbi:hypothetical protein FHX44_11512 [Pseudonocardia hierapolitana]|uniref:Uncharacterized protein n=1 Tax=Pseudonocardia hierapolitana TaxID=1128676 RepID=A0A561SID1_9PSEU|nr:hypothetical protein FHX44_11512 [Pseudonocardia hierapolitana]
MPAVGIAGIGGLAMALHRSMGVRPRRRAADVSWDSTISGVVATLVFLGGSLALRRTAVAEAAPERPEAG